MRPPVPPFTEETARAKVRAAEDAWNGQNPAQIALAYSERSRWRNRSEFLTGREEIRAFLERKWARERDYRLIKELWAFSRDRIAVRFVYECQDADGQWWRCHGNENWQFDEDGYMTERHASINDVKISENERLFRWSSGPRPADHPGLSQLGL